MRGLNAADLEAMERVLIEADFGVPATTSTWPRCSRTACGGAAQDRGRPPRAPSSGRLASMLSGRAIRARIAAGRVGPDGGARRRRERHREDHHRRQARPPAAAGGAKGAARRGRHLSRRRHRAARGLGRAARACPAWPAPPGAIRRRSRSTRSTRPARAGLDTVIDRHRGPAAHAGGPDGRAAEGRPGHRPQLHRAPRTRPCWCSTAPWGRTRCSRASSSPRRSRPTGLIVTKLDGTRAGRRRGGAATRAGASRFASSASARARRRSRSRSTPPALRGGSSVASRWQSLTGCRPPSASTPRSSSSRAIGERRAEPFERLGIRATRSASGTSPTATSTPPR